MQHPYLYPGGGRYDGRRECSTKGENDKEASNLPEEEITRIGCVPMEHTNPIRIFLCNSFIPKQHHREDRDADGGMDKEFQFHHFTEDG